jgi:hypothetical protein
MDALEHVKNLLKEPMLGPPAAPKKELSEQDIEKVRHEQEMKDLKEIKKEVIQEHEKETKQTRTNKISNSAASLMPSNWHLTGTKGSAVISGTNSVTSETFTGTRAEFNALINSVKNW